MDEKGRRPFSPPDPERFGLARPPDTEPYASDLDRLGDELDWVDLRIECQFYEGRLEHWSARPYRKPGRTKAQWQHIDRRTQMDVDGLEHVRNRLEALRAHITARALVTQTEGREFVLDRICQEHELSRSGRQVILRALRHTIPLWPKDQDGQAHRMCRRAPLFIGHVLNYLGLNFGERITLSERLFGLESRLIKGGLIRLARPDQRPPRPDDFFYMRVELTAPTIKRLLGRPLPLSEIGDLAGACESFEV
jgi:hypothetical protein